MKNISLSNLLHEVGIKARYDTEVKKLLSDRTILSWILKFSVAEFKNYSIDEIRECIESKPQISEVRVRPGHTTESITGNSNEDKVIGEGSITYDIIFHVITPNQEHVKIIINVEAQKKYYPGYDLVTRGIFYGARMLSSQLDKEFTTENYDDIKKVYSIWICMETPKYARHTITEYKIVPEKLWGDFSGRARYDLLSVVMICLGNSDSEKNKLIEMLNTVLSEKLKAEEKEQILTDNFGIEMERSEKGGMNTMCNLSDRIEQIGIGKGIEIGIEQTIGKLLKKFTIEEVAEMVDMEIEYIKQVGKK